MRFFKIFTLIVLMLILIIAGCTTEGDFNQEVKLFELKYPNNLKNKSPTFDGVNTHEIRVDVKTNEVLYDKEKLLLKKVKNKETGQKSFVLIIREQNKSNKKAKLAVPEIEERRGFFWDGDCFIYDSYVYYKGSSEPFLFVPASVVAQYISNDCGDYA